MSIFDKCCLKSGGNISSEVSYLLFSWLHFSDEVNLLLIWAYRPLLAFNLPWTCCWQWLTEHRSASPWPTLWPQLSTGREEGEGRRERTGWYLPSSRVTNVKCCFYPQLDECFNSICWWKRFEHGLRSKSSVVQMIKDRNIHVLLRCITK